MAGNVLEWCADWAAAYPPDSGQPLVNPTGPQQGSKRIMRGGCWVYFASSLRATARLYTVAHQRRNYGGFRVARNAR